MEKEQLIKSLKKIKKEVLIDQIVNDKFTIIDNLEQCNSALELQNAKLTKNVSDLVSQRDRLLKVSNDLKSHNDDLMNFVNHRDEKIRELTLNNKEANELVVNLANKNNKLENAFYITALVAGALLVSLMIILFC